MPDRQRDEDRKGNVGLKERDEDEVKKPRQYKVLIHNDDFTPVPFVVDLLKSLFRKSDLEAMGITMAVHQQGIGVAGVYTHEIAETKCAQAAALAAADEHPLLCSMEPES